MKLLLAEDERELSNALVAILENSKYKTDAVYDGEEALRKALTDKYDVIILDIMMPKKSGFEVLEELRKRNDTTPILLLTAKSEMSDRISGLDRGADYYLTKPFDPGELIAGIRSITRRKSEFSSVALTAENITLDRVTFELRSDVSSFRLAGKEFKVLEMLMSSAGKMITTEQFMESIWFDETEAEEGIVWVYISYLRKKLKALDSNVEIFAVGKEGYVLRKKDD